MSLEELKCPSCGSLFFFDSKEWDDTPIQNVIDDYDGDVVYVYKCENCAVDVDISIKVKIVFECDFDGG